MRSFMSVVLPPENRKVISSRSSSSSVCLIYYKKVCFTFIRGSQPSLVSSKIFYKSRINVENKNIKSSMKKQRHIKAHSISFFCCLFSMTERERKSIEKSFYNN